MIEYDTIVEGEVTQQTIEGQANTYPNEIDPTVPKHVKDITKEDIEKWNKGGTGGGGNSGVYVGEDEPTDDEVNVWIDPSGEASGDIAKLEQTLAYILEVIQGGELSENQVAQIEELIVSYFENKTVKEVEE